MGLNIVNVLPPNILLSVRNMTFRNTNFLIDSPCANGDSGFENREEDVLVAQRERKKKNPTFDWRKSRYRKSIAMIKSSLPTGNEGIRPEKRVER